MDSPTIPSFWEDKYQGQQTPWDIGYASPPLRHYVDQVSDMTQRILIPGAGHAHEAIYLHRRGFENVFVCDWAPTAFKHLDRSCPDFPSAHKLVNDFFKLELSVDLILEQTFFCAIPPSLRPDYARKASELLADGGKLAGVLFSENFTTPGPPFGGTAAEYIQYFEPYFHIRLMESSKKSIKPRLGRELFIELEKK
ncbi:MAG: SAM-dependent methyltransferase [Saprospiraceae bacterium]|nr:SAM-dependent methyltransferase [Saprospiraceae bacterium]MCB9322408.1 SAM-dependent methyltransferase [Lewinellaceae bacterium]